MKRNLSARSTWIAAALIGALAVAAPAARPRDSETRPTLRPAEPEETGPLVAPGPEPDLALVYTGGVAGYVEPCG